MAEIKTGSVHVVIPTTLGPVPILELARQPDDVPVSVACVNRTPAQVGMSRGYNEFVTRETGLVSRLFSKPPYPHYRLDVGGPVDAGTSWQLAVLVAHAYEHAGWPEGGPSLVWATATVSNDLRVGRVADVSDKLRLSEYLFVEAREEGRQVHVFLSSEDEAEIEPDALSMLAGLGIVPNFLRGVDEALGILGLPLLEARASTGSGKAARRRWSGNPYRGLQPFDDRHRAVFFGRARAREEAFGRLRRAAARRLPFLLVHGASGAGKSSFVRAGLAGDVEESRPGNRDFVRLLLSPSSASTPLAALAEAVRALAGAQEEPMPTDPVRTVDAMRGWLEGFSSDGGDGVRRVALVIVDQLEEAFDPALPETAAADFSKGIDAVVRSGAAWVVATIRSDALSRIGSLPELSRLAVPEREMRLDPPTSTELLEIIEAPAAEAGKGFADRKVVDRVARIADTAPEALPLIQTVMRSLFDEADAEERLSEALLDRLGGVEEIIGRWADDILARMVASGIGAPDIDRVLVSLIRLDPADRFVARTVEFGGADLPLLRRLVDERLATSVPGPEPKVRLAHDILISHWGHLAELAERVRSLLKSREWLEQASGAWLASGRSMSRLLRGEDVAAAEVFLEQQLVAIDPSVRALVASSSSAKTRGARIRVTAFAAAALIAVGFGATVTWLWQVAEADRRRAETSRAEAERNLVIATDTLEAVADNIALGLRTVTGIPRETATRITEAVSKSTEAVERASGALAPSLQATRAKLLEAVAQSQIEGTIGETGVESAQGAVAAARSSLEARDSADTRLTLAQALNTKSYALFAVGRVDEAGSILDEARVQLDGLAVERPQDLNVRMARSRNDNLRADILSWSGDGLGAIALHRRIMAEDRRTLEEAERSPAGSAGQQPIGRDTWLAQLRRNIASGEMLASSKIAMLYLNLNDPESARSEIDEAVSRLPNLPSDPSDFVFRIRVAGLFMAEGDVRAALGQPPAALQSYQRAEAEVREMLAFDPKSVSANMTLTEAMLRAVGVMIALRDSESAARAGQAVELAGSLSRENPTTIMRDLHARSLRAAAQAEQLRSNAAGALEHLEEGIRIAEGDPNLKVLAALLRSESADAAYALGDRAKAFEATEDALAVIQAPGTKVNLGILGSAYYGLVRKGLLLAEQGRTDEALYVYREARGWVEALPVGDVPEIGKRITSLALLFTECQLRARFVDLPSARTACDGYIEGMASAVLSEPAGRFGLQGFLEAAYFRAGISSDRHDRAAVLERLEALFDRVEEMPDLSPAQEDWLLNARMQAVAWWSSQPTGGN